MVRVLVVDDHRTMAEALGAALSNRDGIVVVGVATSAGEAVAMAADVTPDVVLMDLRLGAGEDGIEVGAQIRRNHPDARIVMLTAFPDPEAIARAAAAGACGFLEKSVPVEEVVDAVSRARDGDLLLDQRTLSYVLAAAAADRDPLVDRVRLSAREDDVLRLLGEGLDPTAISRDLSISIHTTRGHIRNLLRKLEARSQLEAVVKAMRAGLIDPPRPGS